MPPPPVTSILSPSPPPILDPGGLNQQGSSPSPPVLASLLNSPPPPVAFTLPPLVPALTGLPPSPPPPPPLPPSPPLSPGDETSRLLRFAIVVDSLLQSFDRSAFVKRLAQEFSVGGVAPADIALGMTVVDSADPAVLEPLLPSASRRRLASGYLLVSIAIRIPAAATGDEVDSIVGVADHLLQTPSYASSALGVVTVAVPARPSVIRVVGLAVDATASALAAAAGVGGLVGSGSDLVGLPDAAAVIAWDAISAEQAATAQTAVSVAVGLGVGAAVLGVATASVSSVLATATRGLPVGSASSSPHASTVPLVFGFQRLAMRAGVPSTERRPHQPRRSDGRRARRCEVCSATWSVERNGEARLRHQSGRYTGRATGAHARRRRRLRLERGAAGRAMGGDLRAGGAAGGGRLLAAADAAKAAQALGGGRGGRPALAPRTSGAVCATCRSACHVGCGACAHLPPHRRSTRVAQLCVTGERRRRRGRARGIPTSCKGGRRRWRQASRGCLSKEPSTHRRIVRRARHAALPVSLVSLSPEIAVVLYYWRAGGSGHHGTCSCRSRSFIGFLLLHRLRASSSSAAAGVLPYPIAYAIASVVILFLLAVFTLASVIAVRRFHRQYAPELCSSLVLRTPPDKLTTPSCALSAGGNVDRTTSRAHRAHPRRLRATRRNGRLLRTG